MEQQVTVESTSVKEFGGVHTDEEWDDNYGRLQALYDTPRDDKRKPSKASLVLVVGLVLMFGSAGALAFVHAFA